MSKQCIVLKIVHDSNLHSILFSRNCNGHICKIKLGVVATKGLEESLLAWECRVGNHFKVYDDSISSGVWSHPEGLLSLDHAVEDDLTHYVHSIGFVGTMGCQVAILIVIETARSLVGIKLWQLSGVV